MPAPVPIVKQGVVAQPGGDLLELQRPIPCPSCGNVIGVVHKAPGRVWTTAQGTETDTKCVICGRPMYLTA